MFTKTIPRSVVAVALVFLMASGTALAQRGEGGRGGGGRGGGGGDRGAAARSFSGGGERGGSSRSFSGGGERSARSFSGGERPSRSFSRGPSQSFSEGRGGESFRRSFSQPSGGEARSRSFEGSRSGRGISDEGSQFRSYRGGERQTFGRDSFRTDQFGERSIEGDRRRDLDQARRDYQARRPTEGEVRDFLQMRDGQRTAGRVRDDFQRDFRDRDFDRDRGGPDYDRWRRDAWLGERGEGRDQRDWSGRWREGDRFRVSEQIRDHWRGNRDFDDFPFHDQFWRDRDRHHHHWGFWGDFAFRHHRPFYWWTWVAAPRLATWVTFGWPRYYYWDYGPGEYIYYDDGAIYVNGRWYQPAPVFYDRTVELVDRAPDLTDEEAAQMEWLPLGVFAVTREGVTEPEVLVQLAVTQDGVIGGTASVQSTGASYPIEGIVERQTQRAVWEYTDDRNRRVIMETSIFNLTQPEATGLVQYGPDDMRVIQLTRLEQPEGGVPTTATAPEGELPAPAVPR